VESSIDIEVFRQLLIKRREDLLSVSSQQEQSVETVELDQTRVGRLSRMDAMQVQAMSQETQRRRMLELQRIAEALRRINEGEYGYCINCNGSIAQNRLAIDPAASLCIVCASQSEQ
jgi:DnaK suppressor protein